MNPDFICSTRRWAETSRMAKIRHHFAGRIAHDRLAQRQPHLLAAARNGHDARAAVLAVGDESERFSTSAGSRPRTSPVDAGNARGRLVPQHDFSVPSTATMPSATWARIVSLRSFSTATRWYSSAVESAAGGARRQRDERLDLVVATRGCRPRRRRAERPPSAPVSGTPRYERRPARRGSGSAAVRSRMSATRTGALNCATSPAGPARPARERHGARPLRRGKARSTSSSPSTRRIAAASAPSSSRASPPPSGRHVSDRARWRGNCRFARAAATAGARSPPSNSRPRSSAPLAASARCPRASRRR